MGEMAAMDAFQHGHLLKPFHQAVSLRPAESGDQIGPQRVLPQPGELLRHGTRGLAGSGGQIHLIFRPLWMAISTLAKVTESEAFQVWKVPSGATSMIRGTEPVP